jgi:hypothetical protein
MGRLYDRRVMQEVDVKIECRSNKALPRVGEVSYSGVYGLSMT